MADNLATIRGKTAMMYVGEEPWHHLGKRLDKPATAAEAITAAQLDWDVIKVPLHIKFGCRYRVVPDKFAIARKDHQGRGPGPVFGIVGADYTPLQNRDAFAWFDGIVGKGAAIYHTAGALADGERVWILAQLPGEIQVCGTDGVGKYLLLSNSHDGQSSVQVKFTPIRVVCQNTLNMALRAGESIRISHTPSMSERLKLAEENLGIISTRYGQIETAFQEMAAVQMQSARLNDYLVLVFPDPEHKNDEAAMKRIFQARSKALELFETGRGNAAPKVQGTLWAAYNGVTEFIDYYQKSRSPDSRLDSVWFGNGYLSKVRAFRVAADKAKTWKN